MARLLQRAATLGRRCRNSASAKDTENAKMGSLKKTGLKTGIYKFSRASTADTRLSTNGLAILRRILPFNCTCRRALRDK